jgi:hypothetical protein
MKGSWRGISEGTIPSLAWRVSGKELKMSRPKLNPGSSKYGTGVLIIQLCCFQKYI